MYKQLALVSFFVFFLGTITTVNATPILSITGGSGGNPVGQSSHGWTFTANQDILVTELGLYDPGQDGFDIGHEIGLFRLSDGALLTEGFLSAGTGNKLIDNFRYVDTDDALLTSGEDYVISYFSSSSNNDFVVTSASDLVIDPAITILHGNWASSSSLIIPGNTTTSDRFGPGFLYETVTAVSEPASLFLLMFGFAGIVIRKRRS